jgi:hypothetical protein
MAEYGLERLSFRLTQRRTKNEPTYRSNYCRLCSASCYRSAHISILQKRSEDKEKEVREWQSTITYQILLDAKQPMAFSDLYNAYVNKVKNEEYVRVLPSKEITAGALVRVLLALRANQVVGYNSAARYYARSNADEATDLMIRNLVTINELQRIEQVVLKKIMERERRYTEGELFSEVSQETKTLLQPEEFSRIINVLIERQRLHITSDRLLHPEFAEYTEQPPNRGNKRNR